MKNNNISKPLITTNDPNKKKKCSCEDKYGPKPFSNNTTNQNK